MLFCVRTNHITHMKTNLAPATAGLDKEKFVTAKAIATTLGCHPKTVFRWADSGAIHRHKLNARVVLFEEAEVVAFIKKSRVE